MRRHDWPNVVISLCAIAAIRARLVRIYIVSRRLCLYQVLARLARMATPAQNISFED